MDEKLLKFDFGMSQKNTKLIMEQITRIKSMTFFIVWITVFSSVLKLFQDLKPLERPEKLKFEDENYENDEQEFQTLNQNYQLLTPQPKMIEVCFIHEKKLLSVSSFLLVSLWR